MKTNGIPTLKIGMTVIYRGSWGDGPETRTQVESIDLCEEKGEKYGEPVDEVAVEDIGRCCIELADGHWCYGFQIVEVVGFVKGE